MDKEEETEKNAARQWSDKYSIRKRAEFLSSPRSGAGETKLGSPLWTLFSLV